MAYDPNGLYRVVSGVVNIWVLDTVDTLAAAMAANYITDAGPGEGAVVAGKGMQIGDIVHVRKVDVIRQAHTVPGAVTAAQTGFVSAVQDTNSGATSGAGSLTAFT